MSSNNIYTVGIVGIFLSLIAIILKILTYTELFNIDRLIISIVFTISSIFIFMSIYNIFQFTEHDKLGCKINLLGIFSIIPILIYNFCSLMTLALPILITFSGLMTILSSLSILSSILVTLFLFSLYGNSITKKLENIDYKLTLTCSSCHLVLNTLYHITDIIVYNPAYDSFVNKIGLLNYTVALIFTILLIYTYKNIIHEIISIANSKNHVNPII